VINDILTIIILSVNLKKTLLIIPTLNEKVNVIILIEQLQLLNIDILFVDDSSHDGTVEAIISSMKMNKNINLIQRTGKKGYALASIDGFKYGIRKKYEFILSMDADLSHSVKDLKKILELLEKADVIIGSRYIENGKILNWPFYRIFLSRTANYFCRKVLKTSIKDHTSGFRAYSSDALKILKLENINSEGYAFLVEIIFSLFKLNFKILEVPITFEDRKYGKSKLNSKIIFESIFNLFRIRKKVN